LERLQPNCDTFQAAFGLADVGIHSPAALEQFLDLLIEYASSSICAPYELAETLARTKNMLPVFVMPSPRSSERDPLFIIVWRATMPLAAGSFRVLTLDLMIISPIL